MDELSDQPPSSVDAIDLTQPPAPRLGEDGSLVCDQEFFLALARCGKRIWNEWRANQPSESADDYIKVTFEHVDFRKAENSKIDFAAFNFGRGANFAGATFGDKANLSGATFGHSADLSGGTFGLGADISGATFGLRADLSSARFGDGANFSGAKFGSLADFTSVSFGDEANLSGATYRKRASFSGATFGHSAALSGAKFGDEANLSGATFGGRANLSGATFEGGANLSGATFGGSADLSGATFGYQANLSGATFGDEAHLLGVRFGDNADLSGATFGRATDLYGATFGGRVKLSNVVFKEHTDLSGAMFEDLADLSGAMFGEGADLSAVAFGEGANLSGAMFGSRANLSGATFGDRANFSGVTFGDFVRFEGWSRDRRAKYRSNLAAGLTLVWSEAKRTAFIDDKGTTAADPNSFRSIRFTGARFMGQVDFSSRVFVGLADFSNAQFGEPPHFDSLANIDSYGVKIRFRSRIPGWTMRSDVATRLRYLRKLADDAKNHDLERDLYIEERKVERGIYLRSHLSAARLNIAQRRRATTGALNAALFPTYVAWQFFSTTTGLLIHLGWIVVMCLYWLLADYGRSFVRPLVALALSIALFHAAYWLALRPNGALDVRQRATAAFRQAIAWPQANDPPLVRASRAFALANAVPFVGALTLDKDIKERIICGDQPVDEKKAIELGVLPCVPIPPLRFQLLALVQTIVSTACVFFAALALRNYFRVR